MNMKKIIINIVLAVTTVFALSACEDFLDTKNLTQKTTENFPETEKDAQEMVTAIYAHLLFESPETSSQFYVAQLAGDDCLGGNLSYSGNCATNFLLYKDNLNGLLSLWDRDYTLINRANSALASFGNVKSWSSEEEMNRLIGETYFLRAFAYNELVQIFGGVPLRTNTETVNLPRASVEEVLHRHRERSPPGHKLDAGQNLHRRLSDDRSCHQVCGRGYVGSCVPVLHRTLWEGYPSRRNYQGRGCQAS